jgi:hypothetical protein
LAWKKKRVKTLTKHPRRKSQHKQEENNTIYKAMLYSLTKKKWVIPILYEP